MARIRLEELPPRSRALDPKESAQILGGAFLEAPIVNDLYTGQYLPAGSAFPLPGRFRSATPEAS